MAKARRSGPFKKGEAVRAKKDLKDGAIRKGTRGQVKSDQRANRVRVKFQRDPFTYRVVTPRDIERA